LLVEEFPEYLAKLKDLTGVYIGHKNFSVNDNIDDHNESV